MGFQYSSTDLNKLKDKITSALESLEKQGFDLSVERKHGKKI